MSDQNSIKTIIEHSGNTFTFEAVKFLREKKREVLMSPFYHDNYADKPKEIDIIAEKEYDWHDYSGVWTNPRTLTTRLFVECKYINSKGVFWFDKKDTARTAQRVSEITRIPREASDYIQRNHYLKSEEVAKLFSPELGKEDIIYKALTQTLHSMIYYNDLGSIVSERNDMTQKDFIDYPVIVCNNFSNFFRTDYSQIQDNFLFEVNYAYFDKEKNSRNDYFLVDVVSYTYLDALLTQIDADAKTVTAYKSRQRRIGLISNQQTNALGDINDIVRVSPLT